MREGAETQMYSGRMCATRLSYRVIAEWACSVESRASAELAFCILPPDLVRGGLRVLSSSLAGSYFTLQTTLWGQQPK